MNHIDQRGFAPRTITAARTQRAIASRLTVRKGFRRLKWWFRRQLKRFAAVWRYRCEMDLLLQGDDRMLKDIGLTHGPAGRGCRRLALESNRTAQAAVAPRETIAGGRPQPGQCPGHAHPAE
jgi:hypothetical protein